MSALIECAGIRTRLGEQRNAARIPLRKAFFFSACFKARLAGVEPAARGFEVREGQHPGESGEYRSVSLRTVGAARTSPSVPTRPDDHGEFAALVLQEFLSPKQAAERLGVNRETIYRLCAKGVLPHVRVGSVLRIGLADYLSMSERLGKEP